MGRREILSPDRDPRSSHYDARGREEEDRVPEARADSGAHLHGHRLRVVLDANRDTGDRRKVLGCGGQHWLHHQEQHHRWRREARFLCGLGPTDRLEARSRTC